MRCVLWCLLLSGICVAQESSTDFRRLQLTDRYYCDGITAGDIDGDGNMDVVAGPFWYAGPEFTDAHRIYEQDPLPTAPSPSNSMLSFVHDFSGDGRSDILVLGRVHRHAARWYENPGDDSLWPRNFAFERVRGESPLLDDIDGDGRLELLTHWNDRWGVLQPDADSPRDPWSFRAIGQPGDWNQFYHGQGVGDLNGDGRQDIVINDGWFEQPADPRGLWPFHRGRFSRGRGGAQMLVYDVDGDGDNDVVTAIDSHGWGLAWFERVEPESGDAPDLREMGSVRFVPHTIMGDRTQAARFGAAFSQPHALALADIDGDGLRDVVTGKRRWAHGPLGDIEPGADPVVYWFRLRRDEGRVTYEPRLIDSRSGVGVQICVTDVTGDGRPDVLTASKLGAFVFVNRTGVPTE